MGDDQDTDNPRVVASEDLFDDVYTLHEQLGTGAMSVVKAAVHKETGVEYAVKCIAKEPLNLEDEEALVQEVQIMQQLTHPHIVGLHCFFDEPTMFYLVMDQIKGGELFERIVQKEYYTEREARDLIRVLLDTIKYCHDRGVVHRDLKPENLLCVSADNDTNIKLCDFGFAAKIDGANSLTQLCGTPGYVAPEILKRQPYGAAIDMWSIGVLTYILLGGYPPFYDEDQQQLYRKIKSGSFEFHPEYWESISDEAQDLIQCLLMVDPSRRITAGAALSHAWVIGDDEWLENRRLDKNLAEFRRFQARRKFKATAKAVMAAHRLKVAFQRPDVARQESKEREATFSNGRFTDLYDLGGELGTGALSVVKSAAHRKTGVRYAVKCVVKDNLNLEDREALLSEAQIMMDLNHDNIVKLHNIYDEPDGYYLVMDLIEGGELFDRIVQKEYYNELEARDLIMMLLQTVEHIHGLGIVHRDIKPENLLLASTDDDKHVKLCDFGFAAKVGSPQEQCLTQLCGTPGYVAPEILKRKPYGAAVDIWSIGVLTYILLGGYPPFYDDDQQQLYRKIKAGQFEFHAEYWENISSEAQDMIKRMLTVNPLDRISAKAALGHPWLTVDGKGLAGHSLAKNLREFTKYNARRKFKSAAKALIAARRLSLALRPDPVKVVTKKPAGAPGAIAEDG